MDLRCFVKVLPGGEGEWTGGTGYLISRDRVLTAAHVVEGAAEGSIAYDGTGESLSLAGALVEWRGDGDCDIAVLRLRQPVDFDVPIANLADFALESAADWESRGWALALDPPDDALVCDSTVGLVGRANGFASRQKQFEVGLEPLARDLNSWKGVSGAPVFQSGWNRILGVVAAAPEAFHNVLQATPLTRAFLDPRFREALGPPVVLKRRDELIARVCGILTNTPKAAKAIAQRRQAWQARHDLEGPAGLTDVLLSQADAGDLLEELLQTHRELWERRSAAERQQAEAVERILFAVGPLLVLRGMLHALPNADGAVALTLEVNTPSVAELAIAGYEGRPVRWKPDCREEADGLGRIPLPGETGFDVQGEVALSDYYSFFTSGLLSAEDRKHLARLRARHPDDPGREIDEAFRLANDEYDLRARAGAEPLRHYLLFESSWGRKHAVLLRELRARLRAIHFVELTVPEDKYLWERRIAWILRQLLNSKSKPPGEEEN